MCVLTPSYKCGELLTSSSLQRLFLSFFIIAIYISSCTLSESSQIGATKVVFISSLVPYLRDSVC